MDSTTNWILDNLPKAGRILLESEPGIISFKRSLYCEDRTRKPCDLEWTTLKSGNPDMLSVCASTNIGCPPGTMQGNFRLLKKEDRETRAAFHMPPSLLPTIDHGAKKGWFFREFIPTVGLRVSNWDGGKIMFCSNTPSPRKFGGEPGWRLWDTAESNWRYIDDADAAAFLQEIIADAMTVLEAHKACHEKLFLPASFSEIAAHRRQRTT